MESSLLTGSLTLLSYTINLLSVFVIFVCQEYINIITDTFWGGLTVFTTVTSQCFLEVYVICVRRLDSLSSLITENHFKVGMYQSLYEHYLFTNIWTAARFPQSEHSCKECLHMGVWVSTSVDLHVGLCTACLQYSQLPKEGLRVPETGITDAWSLHRGVGNRSLDLWKSSQ